jgi:hypothetical protein
MNRPTDALPGSGAPRYRPRTLIQNGRLMLIRLLILSAAALMPITAVRAQNVVADIQRIASVLQKAG